MEGGMEIRTFGAWGKLTARTTSDMHMFCTTKSKYGVDVFNFQDSHCFIFDKHVKTASHYYPTKLANVPSRTMTSTPDRVPFHE